ncbi:MAG: polyphenol oxidase family protein [Alphaproteobacteria bacterium]|nr:polyphenol oxidase family protein [Alphaproteobacteria bacterium]
MEQESQTIFLTSDILSDFTHGFFGRHGGITQGLCASLNCQLGEPFYIHKDAEENFKAAKKHLGVEEKEIHNIRLIHTDNIHEPTPGANPIPDADAAITDHPNIIVSVTTADCAPILLADPITRTVAAVHAGWKGAMVNIVQKVIKRFEEKNIPSNRLLAAIGPCIAQKHLPLNKSIFEQFADRDKQSSSFFHDLHLDLGGYVESQITHAGVKLCDRLNIDTRTNENFFSARRARFLSENIFGAQPTLITSGKKE